jgi:hypothetical protein
MLHVAVPADGSQSAADSLESASPLSITLPGKVGGLRRTPLEPAFVDSWETRFPFKLSRLKGHSNVFSINVEISHLFAHAGLRLRKLRTTYTKLKFG